MRWVRRVVLGLAVLSLVPMALMVAGATLAGLVGCEVYDNDVVPCRIGGVDIGGLLAGLSDAGWLEFVILPALMAVLALWGALEGLAYLRRRRKARRDDLRVSSVQ